MSHLRACQSILLLTALTLTPAFASRTHRAPTSGHATHKKAHVKKAKHQVIQGQRGIDPDRAREIQTALIKQNYLTGTPSGQWDSETQNAMLKYQADHGWQTKLTPDSRALIKLGLGPDHNAAANTTTASTAQEDPAPSANTLASTHIIQN